MNEAIIVPPSGPRTAVVAVCGEAPGATEIKEGRPFVGRSGKVLWAPDGDGNDLMGMMGYPRESVYVTNVAKFECDDVEWRRMDSATKDSIAAMLRLELDDISPKVVVAVGARASQALVPDFKGVTADHGRARMGYGGRYIVLPVWHPAAMLRGNAAVLGYLIEDLGKIADLVADYDRVREAEAAGFRVAASLEDALTEPKVVPAWPDAIAFLSPEPKPAPKTAKCRSAAPCEGPFRRYAGRGIKWVLCVKHASEASLWASKNLPTMEQHAESADHVARSVAANKMQLALNAHYCASCMSSLKEAH